VSQFYTYLALLSDIAKMNHERDDIRSGTATWNETTPLLAVSEAGPTAQANEELTNGYANGRTDPSQRRKISSSTIPPIHQGEDEDAPLPKLQIFLLCYCSLVEPVAYFSIFPFINQMIKETGSVEEEDVGFWSGMIESLFSFVQMLLMIFYGRMADRVGRKPVLIFSLTGISIAVSLFGLSKELWQMIAFRCAAGLFAGSVVTVRAMITENCTAKTQARAFSFYAFTRNLGIFLGPLIGGALSKPTEQYPRLFGKNRFFTDYPYALPTFFTGGVAASATLVNLFFLKETLNRKGDTKPGAKNEPMSTLEVIKAPGVLPVLGIYTHTMLLGLAFTAVFPVFMFTQPSLGGFGFSIQMISILLAVAGASQALWILLAFPPLQRTFSTGWVLRVCAYSWPVFFAMYPLGNEFLRRGWTVPFWILVPINNIGGSGVSMAFTCAQLVLNDIAPSPSTLGTLNALALTLNSGIRAVAPALFASIFATGVRLRLLHGHLVWVVLVLLGIGLSVAVQWLPKQAEGKIRKDDENEE
jgi:MFS family permease